MYATCLFCHTHLGANDSIEQFPVGRRLAFDAKQGRLWVVCPQCGRWNLTPVEERWEAIEACERRYRATTVRVSTGNVGLARLGDGLDLVRIGKPLRPEFAAWRYGDQFGRRRRRALLAGGAGVAAIAAAGAALVPVVGPALLGSATALVLLPGLTSIVAGAAVGGASILKRHVEEEWVVAHLPGPKGRALTVRARHLEVAELRVGGGSVDDLQLQVEHDGGIAHLTGRDAVRATCTLLAHVNRRGATPGDVQRSVRRIEESGDAAGWLAGRSAVLARRGPKINPHRFWIGALHLRQTEQLTLEMALHEETERAALQGELSALERAWREAEEIASIADNLLVPDGIADRLRRLRD